MSTPAEVLEDMVYRGDWGDLALSRMVYMDTRWEVTRLMARPQNLSVATWDALNEVLAVDEYKKVL